MYSGTDNIMRVGAEVSHNGRCLTRTVKSMAMAPEEVYIYIYILF